MQWQWHEQNNNVCSLYVQENFILLETKKSHKIMPDHQTFEQVNARNIK